MKKLNSLVALAVAAIILLMTACQKDPLPQQNTVTKEKLVGRYKVTSMKLKATNGAEEDLFATLPDCEKQSTQALNADLTWNRTSICDPTDNQTSTWAYIDTKRIVINGLMGDIASFDGTHLVLTFKDFLGIPGTLTETLTKQ